MDGEVDEFEEIYKAYFDDIFKMVYRRVLNRQEAEDIAQETFFAAFKIRDEFLGHPQPRLWLRRTANNKMRELYRRRKHQATEPLEEESPALARQETRYGEIELELSALAVISEQEWRIIGAHHVCGITIAELAKSETVTENNMRVRLFRFRKKLVEGMK